MRAVRTEDCNIQYQGATDTEIGNLPARREVLKWVIEHPRRGIVEVAKPGMHWITLRDGTPTQVPAQAICIIRSTWELEEHELEMIAATNGRCRVTLTMYGDAMPPTALGLAPMQDDEDGS